MLQTDEMNGSHHPSKSKGFGPGAGCGIGVANGLFALMFAFGMGMSSRPRQNLEATVYDMPWSMALIVLALSLPASIAIWVGFRNNDRRIVGAVIALAYFAIVFAMLRESVKVG